VNVESAYVEQRKLRFAWFWWSVGYILLAWTVNDSLERHPPNFGALFASDKVLHFTGYFLLATWFGGVARRGRYVIVGLGLIAFSGVMEIAQGIMHHGREADWLDFLANTLGVTFGLVLATLGLGRWMIWVERLLGLQK
jgi:VanZ family protein